MGKRWLQYLVFLIPVFKQIHCQSDCNSAPTASLRITCQQINNWALNTRNVPVTTRTLVSAPGSAGLTVGSVAISALASSAQATTAYECTDIACLCGFFGGTGGSSCVLASGQTLTKGLRKEYRTLTDDERQRYNTAMWTIKRNGDYDTLSRIHSQFMTSPGAHSGPAFLPWHREFIKRLEIALRRVDPTVSLPYWDSTLDSTIPTPSDSVLWGNELMGKQGSDGTVQTGAFRGWPTVDGSRTFMRNIGDTGGLITQNDMDIIMGTTDFQQILASTAPQQGCPNPAQWTCVEYVHGSPHVFTGGDMLITTTATNDPLFFNHHSFIDLIWELWRLARQTRAQRETQYPSDSLACSSSSHYGGNTMAPFFPYVNTDGLSNNYTDNLYQYAPRPTCTRTNRNGCGSKYLFCDVSHGNPRCASKILIGGACGGYTNNEDRCYLGQCTNNICTEIPTPTPTTQSPIVTTTPIAPVQETCFNEQQCCAPWATRGECTRNPTYMSSWCRASCSICTPTTYSLNTECSNRHVMCATWAARGECRNNPAWMSENCRMVCNLCGRTRAQACNTGVTTSSTSTTTTTTTTTITTTTTTIAPPVNPTCINQHYCCIGWSSRGYCAIADYQDYMSRYCQAACNFCSNSAFGSIWNTQACSDGNSNCRTWTARGECNNNRAYMWENCRQSCQACSIGMLSTRLTSCGFSRRLTSRRQPISVFRVRPDIRLLRRKSSLVAQRLFSLAPAPKKAMTQKVRQPLEAPKKTLEALKTRRKSLNRIQRRGFGLPQKDLNLSPQKPARIPDRPTKSQRPRSSVKSRRRIAKEPARPTGKLVLPRREPMETISITIT